MKIKTDTLVLFQFIKDFVNFLIINGVFIQFMKGNF